MKSETLRIRKNFKESSILFQSESSQAISAAIEAVRSHRMNLERYILVNQKFLYTLKPVKVEENAPRVVKMMAEAGELAEVGPMAAVAGALADLAIEAMLNSGANVAIIEDGGEIAASSQELFIVGLYVGRNVLSGSIGFQVNPSDCPIGIATSSATVSHAFSFGEADAATIFAGTSCIADAFATAVCNAVQGKDIEESIQKGLEIADRKKDLIRGTLIIRGMHVGTVGKIPQLVKIGRGFKVNKISLLEAATDRTIFL
ncbi:MAG: uncharacterized protein QG670_1033 [Thermoproteota archaeon]|nr:uncharacterized protein [Thermoproteota archaeon]